MSICSGTPLSADIEQKKWWKECKPARHDPARPTCRRELLGQRPQDFPLQDVADRVGLDLSAQRPVEHTPVGVAR
jgi:hypothetical protein